MDPADEVGQNWPCPRCGRHVFFAALVFERGYEDIDGSYVHFYPPAAHPMDVDMDSVICAGCALQFSLRETYALADQPTWPDLDDEDDCDCDEDQLDDCECDECLADPLVDPLEVDLGPEDGEQS